MKNKSFEDKTGTFKVKYTWQDVLLWILLALMLIMFVASFFKDGG